MNGADPWLDPIEFERRALARRRQHEADRRAQRKQLVACVFVGLLWALVILAALYLLR